MHNVHPFQLGSFECAVLYDGSRSMPLADIFPNVPTGLLHQAAIECNATLESVEVGYNLLYSDHSAVEIASQGETLLHVVDAIRHPVQVANPEWASFIDSLPAQIGPTNRLLLDRAVDKQATVFGAHLAFPALGRVEETDEAWRWNPLS